MPVLLLRSRHSAGQVRKNLTNRPVRFWTVQQFPNYVLVYRPDTQPLQVVRILHGKQNIQRILGGR